jgi:hypothetical protein
MKLKEVMKWLTFNSNNKFVIKFLYIKFLYILHYQSLGYRNDLVIILNVKT